MGIWRFAGAFAVVERQGECGSKTAGNARQPAGEHRRVLPAGHWLYIDVFMLREFVDL